LATVLIAGTIALLFPSFMTIDAAQAQPYYGGMDSYNDRKSYGMDDSYGSSDYKIDNDRKSYDNGYESQYPSSYKSDYKPAYPSYGKDDRDKSKYSKVDIKKIRCINTNLNINGNNTGNVSIGNKGQVTAAEEEYLGASSSSGSEYGDERYYDGYNNKKDIGFECIINNNNTNVVLAGGGNVTDGNGNITEPQTCEECFRAFLTEDQISDFLPLGGSLSLEEFCNSVESGGFDIDESVFRSNLASIGVSVANINALIECLENSGIQFNP
jgi:hypothetical protein